MRAESVTLVLKFEAVFDVELCNTSRFWVETHHTADSGFVYCLNSTQRRFVDVSVLETSVISSTVSTVNERGKCGTMVYVESRRYSASPGHPLACSTPWILLF